MRYLKTTEAATLLKVAPATLRMWERRFGFPEPQRSAGGHRWYMHGEVSALREALQEGLSIAAAVMRARASLAADARSLVRALLAYDRASADRAIETTLAVRSVERSVEDVLLPSLEDIVARNGSDSAGWAFSARWAADWLARARRLASPPASHVSILIGNASEDELDLDAYYIRALELFCERAGVKVLGLPARALNGLGGAALVHRPDLLILAGGQVRDDITARWSRAIDGSVGPVPLVLYRPSAGRAFATVLPPSPGEAQLRLLELAHAAATAGIRPLRRQGRAFAAA